MKPFHLREIRYQLGLTQQELARETGLARKSIYKAERRQRIHLRTAITILEILNPLRGQKQLHPLTIDDLDWEIFDR